MKLQEALKHTNVFVIIILVLNIDPPIWAFESLVAKIANKIVEEQNVQIQKFDGIIWKMLKMGDKKCN